MNSDYSRNLSRALRYSREEADRLESDMVNPEHMLLGLIRTNEGKAIEILRKLSVDISELKHKIESKLGYTLGGHSVDVDDIPISMASTRILKLCDIESQRMGSSSISTKHLLLAILRDGTSLAAEVLKQEHVSYDNVKANATDEEDREVIVEAMLSDDDDIIGGLFEKIGKKHEKMNSSKKKKQDGSALSKFGVDLTAVAQEGGIDPVVGRNNEIERIAQILCRRKKNNPVLIGEPGVGKSAIAEGLAVRIVEKKVPRILFDKRVVALDMSSLVAGTMYRGQFEERMQAMIKELKKNPNIILFIDEIHTIVGAGATAGGMDAANILKPALARGEIQCIGSTTLDEYRKSIEKDGALERRFQKVVVEPTTEEETYTILKNIKDKYEDYHSVSYSDEALRACVKLTGRYITERQFPDKAIDALDEAGSRARVTDKAFPQELIETEKKLEECRENKKKAIISQNFELAASYHQTEVELQAMFESIKAEWDSQEKENKILVDVEDIENVVSLMSGVPVQKMAETEGNRLAQLKNILKAKVIAQDEAVDKVVKAILRNRVGLKDPNKPIGTFLFLGPTGVGKTYLAQKLAEEMFGSKDALIRVDMSEYMEKYSVSRMVGAAPGYVGYEDGGQLTEKVRRKPYSIVLLDEIEKAHADVYNILLQVLDEGRLTDNVGRTIDFKNTIIIMTSNVGTRQLKDFSRGIGFSNANVGDNQEYQHSVIQKALNKTFSPEFLNRLDEIVNFDQLSENDIVRIVDIELKGLIERVKDMGITITVDTKAKRFLANKGYDVQFGARPLKRSIQTYIEDVLAEKIITQEIASGDVVEVTHRAKADNLTFRKK